MQIWRTDGIKFSTCIDKGLSYVKPMLCVFTLCQLLIVFNLVFAGISHGQESIGLRGPRISFDNSVFDFGSVPQGQKVEHDFSFTNNGDTALTIHNIVPGCGCTASSTENSSVPPGEKGSIHVVFDTTGFSGKKLKTVRVYTNDVDSPTSILSVTGNVEMDVTIQPARVFFDSVSRGSQAVKDVVVEVRPESDTRILEVKTYSKFLKLTFLEKSDKRQKFSVSLDPDAKVGELRSRIVVNLTGKTPRAINIPVFASVKEEVQLKPSTLSFGVFDQESPIVKKVKLVNTGDQAVSISRISSNNKAVRGDFTQIQEGKIYVIDVEVDPSLVSNDLRAVLDVYTQGTDDKKLSLSVLGVQPPQVQ